MQASVNVACFPACWKKLKKIVLKCTRGQTRQVRKSVGDLAQFVVLELQVDQGSAIRIVVLDGALRTATVEGCTAEQVLLQLGDQLAQQPLPTADTLLLATPRPKVLLRMLSHAAAMGFASIILFRSWRVDKTWMQSRAFDSDV